MSVEAAWQWANQHEAPAYLVGAREHLLGIVTRQRLEEWHATDKAHELIAVTLEDSFVHAHPDHSIDIVLERLTESGGVLPIVSRTQARRVEGIVTPDSVLSLRGQWPISKTPERAEVRDDGFGPHSP